MRVTLENWNVDRKLDSIAKNNSLGLYAAEQMQKGMDKYVPYEHGDLAGDAYTQPFSVTYAQPYARYQYANEGLHHSKEQHPLATGKWDEAWNDASGTSFAQELETFIRTRL